MKNEESDSELLIEQVSTAGACNMPKLQSEAACKGTRTATMITKNEFSHVNLKVASLFGMA